ncbi:hypothetical protein EK21DRAFT_90201 [Setomelanomma holmii]|uniref:Uncharacterized protein n=1 Tax=Setomelanomma holmii TaxID=210430 RepID=A0A9P4LKQ6_9PLEO|nr:hypothetical protein EK21DRAFT_90201 [Setomelanomma holmii]
MVEAPVPSSDQVHSVAYLAAFHRLTFQTFRFLDLPAEIRCMIYERISIDTKHHILTKAESDIAHPTWPNSGKTADASSITLLRKSLSVAILRTCRRIWQEATPVLSRILAALALQPIHFLVDYSALRALVTVGSPLLHCFGSVPPLWKFWGQTDTSTEDFVRSCSLFMAHKRRLHDRHGTDVIITITEKHQYLGPSFVQMAFSQIRNRAHTLKLCFEIVYRDDLTGPGRPPGSFPSTAVVKTVGLRGPMFRDHLRELETIR